MRILDDVEHREVGDEIGVCQRGERDRHEHELHDGDGARDGHQRAVARQRFPTRARPSARGKREGENQCVMAGFDDHGASPGVRVAAPHLAPLVSSCQCALLLQGVGDFARHVGFVVLGEHGIGAEDATASSTPSAPRPALRGTDPAAGPYSARARRSCASVTTKRHAAIAAPSPSLPSPVRRGAGACPASRPWRRSRRGNRRTRCCRAWRRARGRARFPAPRGPRRSG